MQYAWTYTRNTRQWVRTKEVDLSYCLYCNHCKAGFKRYDHFCKYDGYMIDQACDEDFEMWCPHYTPWKLINIPLY